MTSNLGTVKVFDLSHRYAPGSFLAEAKFTMFGLNFVAKKLKRTDSYKVDNFELYIKPDGEWCEDYIKTFKPTDKNLSKVDRRAIHLLMVATAAIPADTDARFEALELE